MNQGIPNPPLSRLETDSEDSENLEYPDVLELTEEFSDELRASLEAVDGDSATRSVNEVAQRHGLAW